MATDYYEDSAPAPKERKAKAGEGSATALLPLDFFPEKPAVGKVCQIKVEKVYSDQAEVSYQHKAEAPKEKEMPEDEGMMGEEEDMMMA